MSRYRVGTTSWTYKDWVGSFYAPGAPPHELLGRYASVFPVVECDATFYRMPSPDTTARWAADTPPGFTMTVKLPQRITHEHQMRNVEEPLAAFLARIAPLREAGKLGPLLAQFPPSFRRERGAEALEPFLHLVPEGVRMAFEFRHPSWHVPATYDALRAAGASLVWQVHPDGHSPPEVTAGFLYVRLIGPDRVFTKFDRIQRDLRPAMEALRERLEGPGAAARDVLLFASNHFMGHGPSTAALLCEALGLPPPDMAAAARGAGQRNLADFA